MTNVINDTKYNSWSNINWIKINRVVKNIQHRIFIAKKNSDFRKLKKLQNLILLSKYNKLISIKKICQLNLNKNILGFDKDIFLTEEEVTILIKKLYEIATNNWKPTLKNIIEISRINNKLCYISIYKLIDLILQVVVKNALEPEWAKKFNHFNNICIKNKSIYDKINNINNLYNYNSFSKYWIINFNIKNYFYIISYKLLINQLSNFPAKKIIFKWLKIGYINKTLFKNDFFNVFQKNIINNLLISITIDNIKNLIELKKNNEITKTLTLINYLDNFIIFCNTKIKVIEIYYKIKFFLRFNNLFLYYNKINIINIKKGVNFLGFHLKLYKCKQKDKFSKQNNKFFIKPSLQSQIKFQKKLKIIWNKSLGLSIIKVIKKINLMLKNWANYFKLFFFDKRFIKIDYYNWIRQCRFAKRTHPKKSWKWIKMKYLLLLNKIF